MPDAYVLKVLRDLIAIPSITCDEGQIADYIERELRRHDIATERDADHNVIGFVGDGDKLAVVNGHLDTVPPSDNWTHDPYDPVEEAGRIRGLGASDMKSGLALMLHLAHTIRPKVRIAFAFTVREENGEQYANNGAKTFVRQHDFDYVIATEPSFDEASGRLLIGLGCQGRAIVRLRVKGKAAHSAQFRSGVNAIYLAAGIARRVEERGLSFQPVPVTADISCHPAISVTRVHGGIADNVIPDRCELTIDRRLAVNESADDARREIQQFTEGIDCDVEWLGETAPTLTDLSGELYRKTVAQFNRTLGHAGQYFASWRFDLCYFAQKCRQLINIGPGSMSAPHKPDEWVTLEGLDQAERVLGPLLEDL